MTIESTTWMGLPIRIDELRRGDHVLFLGNVVEVLDLARHSDFQCALQVVLRRMPEGKSATALLPQGHMVTGMYLPRRFNLRCVICGRLMSTDADLALGTPRRAMCESCSNPLVERTSVLPRVDPKGRGRPRR